MLYAEIQFNRPMKLPSMTRAGTRLTDVEAEPTFVGLEIASTTVPWCHILFALHVGEMPDKVPGPGNASRPNEGATVSVSSDKPSRRGHSKRAGQPDKP